MPTGYTSEIQDGKITKFRDFAMLCARAFGACVLLRDEQLSPDIPEFTIGEYYVTSVETQRKELGQLQAMTPEQVAAAHAEFYAADDKWRTDSNAKKEQARAAYQKMLDEAKAFKPATSEHVKHREFMIEQLTESIAWDCGKPYVLLEREPVDVWHAKQIADKAKYLARSIESLEEEKQRVSSRNKWVKDLRESLDRHEESKVQ